MTPTITVHLHGDGYRVVTRGIHPDEQQHRISNAVKLAGRDHERIRCYVKECCGLEPLVVGRVTRMPSAPPSDIDLVAGEE